MGKLLQIIQIKRTILIVPFFAILRQQKLELENLKIKLLEVQ